MRRVRVSDARPRLVDRTAPVLAVPATTRACCVCGAPEEPSEVVIGPARRARVTQAVDVPHCLHPARVAWICVRVGIERFERRTTNARHPGLGRGVVDVDDGCSIALDAVESPAVACGTEHALALERHLLEDQVLGLCVCSRNVILTYAPAGAD